MRGLPDHGAVYARIVKKGWVEAQPTETFLKSYLCHIGTSSPLRVKHCLFDRKVMRDSFLSPDCAQASGEGNSTGNS